MTKFKTAEGWGYLVITLDWYSKKIVGHHLSGLSHSAARFMKTCHHLGIEQIFTSYNNPKENA